MIRRCQRRRGRRGRRGWYSRFNSDSGRNDDGLCWASNSNCSGCDVLKTVTSRPVGRNIGTGASIGGLGAGNNRSRALGTGAVVNRRGGYRHSSIHMNQPVLLSQYVRLESRTKLTQARPWCKWSKNRRREKTSRRKGGLFWLHQQLPAHSCCCKSRLEPVSARRRD